MAEKGRVSAWRAALAWTAVGVMLAFGSAMLVTASRNFMRGEVRAELAEEQARREEIRKLAANPEPEPSTCPQCETDTECETLCDR